MMIQSNEDILTEIDSTIDQLLENGKALKKISLKPSYQEEMLALEKTQESLIAHLMHLDEMLKKKDRVYTKQEPLLTSKVHDKLGRSGYLNQMQSKKDHLEEHSSSKKPKIHKRKAFIEKCN
jgi:hypothetical protein